MHNIYVVQLEEIPLAGILYKSSILGEEADVVYVYMKKVGMNELYFFLHKHDLFSLVTVKNKS